MNREREKVARKLLKMAKSLVAVPKTAAGSGAANAKYLDSLPSGKKAKILKHVAKHYGVSVSEIESELKDRDAENLFEYTATDKAMSMEIYSDFKRQRLIASTKTAAPKSPFEKAIEKAIEEAIREAKRDGITSMSMKNMMQVVRPPKASLEGAPLGINAPYHYREKFRDIAKGFRFVTASKIAKSLLSKKYNDKSYKFYVVAKNKIESGWEYKEDARDNVAEMKEEGIKGKVLTKTGLDRSGLNPDDDSSWMQGSRMAKS